MPLTTQPTGTEDELLTMQGKHLGDLIPCVGIMCFTIFADRGAPGTIGCSYSGDLLCCDVSSEEFCRTRCAWLQSCCCLEFRAGVPTDSTSNPLVVNCCFVTVLFQRSWMFKFLASVDELREEEKRQRLAREAAAEDPPPEFHDATTGEDENKSPPVAETVPVEAQGSQAGKEGIKESAPAKKLPPVNEEIAVEDKDGQPDVTPDDAPSDSDTRSTTAEPALSTKDEIKSDDE